MSSPFTVEQFFDVFGAYNTAIWPAQVVAYFLGIISIALVFKNSKGSNRLLCSILALFWIWTGSVYHFRYFSLINPLSWIFGAAFILQGALFLWVGIVSEKIFFEVRLTISFFIGACFIAYSMLVYPLLNVYFGHAFPKAPMFGVAPCPMTIFTFGVLLWTTKPMPGYLLITPLLWSLIGVSAAINLKVPQDFGLVFAGVIGSVLIVFENHKAKKHLRITGKASRKTNERKIKRIHPK